MGRLAAESELIDTWLGSTLVATVVTVPSNRELVFAFLSADEEVIGANDGEVKSRFDRPATFLALKSDQPASTDELRLASTEEGVFTPDTEPRVP